MNAINFNIIYLKQINQLNSTLSSKIFPVDEDLKFFQKICYLDKNNDFERNGDQEIPI